MTTLSTCFIYPCNFSQRIDCLLHLNFNLSRQDTILLNNLLTVAKSLIAKKWETDEIPTVHELRFECQFLLLINKLTAIKRGSELASYDFSAVWSKFIYRTQSDHMINQFWNYFNPV